MKMRIKMAAYLSESETNGPGIRSVLWVQGCPKRCPGCWNNTFLRNDGGRWVKAEEAAFLLTRSPNIEGVTFLGGEPFAQAEALSELALLLKKRGLSLMAYSGFSFQELESQGPAQRDLLSYCDLLVDGEFLQEKAGPFLWRGSKNQEVHFITPRYESWRNRVEEEYRDFEIFWEGDRLVLTGDPHPEMMEVMQLVGKRVKDHG